MINSPAIGASGICVLHTSYVNASISAYLIFISRCFTLPIGKINGAGIFVACNLPRAGSLSLAGSTLGT